MLSFVLFESFVVVVVVVGGDISCVSRQVSMTDDRQAYDTWHIM